MTNQDVLQWAVRPHKSLLAPRGRYAFRVVTQLDPLDFLLFAGLVWEVASDLEAARVPKDRDIVFSYRLRPDADGNLFDPEVGYEDFRWQSEREIQENGITHVAMRLLSGDPNGQPVIIDLADELRSADFAFPTDPCAFKFEAVFASQELPQPCFLPLNRAPSGFMLQIGDDFGTVGITEIGFSGSM